MILGSCARAIGGAKNSSGNVSHVRVNVLDVRLRMRDNYHGNIDVTGNGTGTFLMQRELSGRKEVRWGSATPRAAAERRAGPAAPIGLYGQQPLKEGSELPQGLTQVLGGHVVSPVPLLLQPAALTRECLRQTLHGQRNRFVGLLHRGPRLVQEPSLDLVLAAAQVLHHV